MGKIAAVLRRHAANQRRRVARGKARQPSLPPMPEHVVRRFEDMDIAFLDLGTRFCNALKKNGLSTVGSLTRLTKKDLLRLRWVSKRCVEEVEVELYGIGRELRPSAGRKRG